MSNKIFGWPNLLFGSVGHGFHFELIEKDTSHADDGHAGTLILLFLPSA